MKLLILNNGIRVLFERSETHDDKVLFFREPIGLVWAAHTTDIKEIQDANTNNRKTQA